MGITGAASGNEVQHQQAIDPTADTLKPTSLQASPEAKGFTGTREVIKANADTIVSCQTEPIEELVLQSDSKAISQREVTQSGCKEFLLGKKPDETIEGICAGTCLTLIGLAFLIVTGSGIVNLKESPASVVANASQFNSTPPSNLTFDKYITGLLQHAISASSAPDTDDSFSISGILPELVFITVGVAIILLTRFFCTGNDAKKTDKDQNREILNLEAGTSEISNLKSYFEDGDEGEYVPVPDLSHKKKQVRNPVEKMPAVSEGVAGPSGTRFITEAQINPKL